MCYINLCWHSLSCISQWLNSSGKTVEKWFIETCRVLKVNWIIVHSAQRQFSDDYFKNLCPKSINEQQARLIGCALFCHLVSTCQIKTHLIRCWQYLGAVCFWQPLNLVVVAVLCDSRVIGCCPVWQIVVKVERSLLTTINEDVMLCYNCWGRAV